MEYYKLSSIKYVINEKRMINEKLEKDKYSKLKISKDKIDDNKINWEKNKKYMNMYEYVYTSSNNKNNISNIYPISRSYFKLREILYFFRIKEKINKNNIICLCEAPGGFIQCLREISIENNYKINQMDVITLLSESNHIPYWSNSIINNKDINIHSGVDGTGDIFILKNVLKFIKDSKKSMIITGDGGFDYSVDYNKQEDMSYPLIYSEIMIALSLQEIDGIFICKMFDIFNLGTFQLIYLLCLSYDEIFLYKPKMSRLSNSEKYIICKGFKGYNKEIMNILIHNFQHKCINIELPEYFIKDILNYNEIFVKMQISNIESCFQKQKPNNFKEKVETSKDWCIKYDVPINYDSKYFKSIYHK